MKFHDCRYSKRLLNKLVLINQDSQNKVNLKKIQQAIYFAKKYHADQKRGSGEPYYSHPLEVAYMVADYLFKTDIIATAILHDTIEDTELTKEIIAKEFGNKIACQVEDLTRIKQDRKISSAELIEILFAQRKDDLLLVKLFDRLHNMQTIEAKPLEKAYKIASETLLAFLAIATYLEMPNIYQQLNIYCFNTALHYKQFNLYNTV